MSDAVLKRAIKGWSKMSFHAQDFIRIKLLGDNNGSADRPACCLVNGDCSSSAVDPQHISARYNRIATRLIVGRWAAVGRAWSRQAR